MSDYLSLIGSPTSNKYTTNYQSKYVDELFVCDSIEEIVCEFIVAFWKALRIGLVWGSRLTSVLTLEGSTKLAKNKIDQKTSLDAH
ncbi:MAG: hypothetical protein KME17_03140 [Cyanosarcina radialis HA8281-LM2]|jgi:hypothetical protein|nr:hypothetical protein [Cyanosarcina radialis HA8281-LM2]